MSKPIVRSMMMLKLGNMISGLDGVTVELADYLVNRLNDDWCPWVPRDGHGMAGDATAHSHCFQTLIGEGFCVGATGERLTAQQALSAARVKPFQVQAKDGAALINGLAASPAMAVHVAREAESMMRWQRSRAHAPSRRWRRLKMRLPRTLAYIPKNRGSREPSRCLGGS